MLHGEGRSDCVIDYFTKVLEDDLKAVTKPQYVDQIPKAVKGENRTVGFQMEQRCQVDQERLDEIADVLGTLKSRGQAT
jgi:ATP-binding cassette subfamily E protein 1